MTDQTPVDVRRATAARNVDAILDAAEGLLRNGKQITFSAVAEASTLSRPTVYAHFADRSQLLAGLIARALRKATAEMEAASPDKGPPVQALRRVIAASWEQLARHQEIARAVGPDVSSHAFHASHHAVRVTLERLMRRGRSEGVFRADRPIEWLMTCTLALIHAAAALMESGQVDHHRSLQLLVTTVEELWVGRTGAPGPTLPATRRARA
jgi:AcrR family transcriptional regulator